MKKRPSTGTQGLRPIAEQERHSIGQIELKEVETFISFIVPLFFSNLSVVLWNLLIPVRSFYFFNFLIFPPIHFRLRKEKRDP